MDAYEIRIVTPAQKLLRSYSTSYAGDFAAIRRARALIEDGQGVEVWRGGHCIYTADALAAAEGRRHGI